jgi:Subtilase family/Carboxypeptidase regulatory-like domain
MLRSRLRQHSLFAFALLIALLGASLPPIARTASSAPVVSASPTTISVSVPLGQRVTQTITLTNNSNSTMRPLVYEAWPTPPGQATRARGPSEPARVALPQQTSRLDTRLLADLQAAPDGRADLIVYLRDQADLSAAYAITDWDERGRYVYETLTSWANSHQAGLRRALTARGLSYRPFWIINAVLVHGSLDDAQALVARSDVALVGANHTVALSPETATPAAIPSCSPDDPTDPVCWNIRKIGADRVWHEFGINGQGIVVASIDTGVSYTHPALSTNYRGYLGPGRYDHNYNWYDPHSSQPAPADAAGHGTHTMGTMIAVGDGTTDQPESGVAPGAHWIAAKGCDTFCSEADLTAAAQWMLAPTALDGSRPRPDLRPLIINNSWAGGGGDTWYAGYTAAWRAAGIFPVFAAGNDSSRSCGSIGSPGDYSDVVGVGATDQNDTIAGFSLLGPTSDGRLKPDFTAPGVAVVSTWTGGASYYTNSGTSMATPHIAGTVALLWSANPALIGDYDATYAILRDTAKRLSDTSCGDPAGAPNNVYGQGRVDAFAAVARARVDVPWMTTPTTFAALAAHGSASFSVALDAARVPGPGTYTARLQVYSGDLSQPPATIVVTMKVTSIASQAVVTGRVVSAEDHAPLAANVGIHDGTAVATDSTGAYTFTLAPGDYELIASANSFLPAQRPISVTGDLHLSDIELQPDQPRIAVASPPLSATLTFRQQHTIAVPITNSGVRALSYHVTTSRDEFAVWRSDEPGGPAYNWVDLPPSAPKLVLGDNAYTDTIPLKFPFPFFSYSFTETLVTSNGTLAFDAPLLIDQGALSTCLPDDQIYFYLIAPFRADLDPSRGGQIRYGTLADRQTFVLSYENIPLHTGPITATYTFQVLLHSDGRIVFQYKKLAALPGKLSLGVQYAPSAIQQIACGASAPLSDGLAIELRPQVPSDLWLADDTTAGSIPPGGQKVLHVLFVWVQPQRPGPYRGQIEITSSDPTHPSITLPVQVDIRPAPYEQWLVPVNFEP